MCGFAGIVNSSRPLSLPFLEECARLVSHRGPDSTRLLVLGRDLLPAEQGPHGFFFNRLAILDLDPRSDQPFSDDRHTLVFNGEIYNYLELRNELVREGVRFRTQSDTEVLFEALKRWGPAALPKLNGMFAFFFLDAQTGSFLAARDRIGIKPLCYRRDGDCLAFASEARSVLRLSGAASSRSRKAIEAYLWLQYVPTPLTAFEGVLKLPPGHFLEGRLAPFHLSEPKPFWDAYNPAPTPPREVSLEETLRSSMERQFRSDVPLGLFLSSGVDSSLLAAMVARYFASSREYDFFTVGYDGKAFNDEWADAHAFLAGFRNPNLRHHQLTLSASDVMEALDALYSYLDEPFGDSAAVLNFAISRKARERVTVALSGDGADELFWGYPRYTQWQDRMVRARPRLRPLAIAANVVLPGTHIARRLAEKSEADPVALFFSTFLQEGLAGKKGVRVPTDMWCLEGVDGIRSREDFPARFDLKTYLADAMLYKVDRGSMAVGLEVRVPYLDNEVIDASLRMPLSSKSTPTDPRKAPLRGLLAHLAPHYDFHLPKKGFNFPVRDWLATYWHDRVQSLITRDLAIEAGLDPAVVQRLLDDHFSGRQDATTAVWYLFQLALWLESVTHRGRREA
jgi:asparagine synthase (glutamine-hydrolysing)